MSIELVKGLEHVVGDSGCVFDALNPILESCHVPEDLHERMWLSAQLSVCEFQTAGIVDYPRECLQKPNCPRCLQLLESKSTWWTTFTANFHHIGVICSEHRHTFEADHLVEVYRNTSRLFDTYQSEMETSLKQLVDQHEQLVQRSNDAAAWAHSGAEIRAFLTELSFEAQNLSNWMETIKLSSGAVWESATNTELGLAEINSSVVSVAQALIEQLDMLATLKQSGEQTTNVLRNIELDVGELESSTAKISQQIGELGLGIENANIEFAVFQQEHTAALERFQLAVENCVATITASFESVSGPLYVLAAIGGVFRNMLWVFFGLVMYYGIRRFRPVHASPAKVEIDVAFY